VLLLCIVIAIVRSGHRCEFLGAMRRDMCSVGRSWDDFVPPISCAHASSTSQLRHEPWQACA